MDAVVLSRYGSPDDLELRDVPRPEPKDDEVLVRVHASAVNDYDWTYVRGKPFIYRLLYGLRRPNVSILGAEVAGVVEAVGGDVKRFRVGDAVYGDVSEAGFGGFAEYVCVRDDALGRMPAGMTFEQAATLPHAAGLAYQGLVDVGRIKEGDRVLINGAGGGVGVIGLQIAKRYGSEVTGVDRKFKLERLKQLGFDHVIDYEQEDFTRNGERYDLILDTKTTRPPARYLRALDEGGRYVTVGGHLPRLLQAAVYGPLVARVKGRRIRLVALKPNKDLGYVNEMFETHGIECVIDGPYPLREVPRAIGRFGAAEHVGKIVIKVA